MRRLWAAAALVWLPLAVTVATWSAWSDRLPSRLATHWNGAGDPDRFSSTTGFLAAMLTVGIVAGVTALVAAFIATRAAHTVASAGHTVGSAGHTVGSAGHTVGSAGHTVGSAGHTVGSAGHTVGSAGFAGDKAGQAGNEAGLAAVERAARLLSGARFMLIAAGAVSGAAAGMWVATATATLADPGDPRLGWRLLYFGVGLAWGLVVRAAAGKSSRPVLPVAPAVDPLDLGPTERAAYSTTLRSPMLAGVTLVSAAVVAVLAVTTESMLWLVAVVPLLAGLTFGRIRVSVDRRGLRLVAGLIGVPIKQIPLTDIAGAETAEIVPTEWGGWGYRVMPGRTALVLRGGPGLVLQLRDGRRFAVTLDDPRTPAALLTALLARAHS
ncbi:DUF1648 domain-containing protein [Actinoplanes sp. NBC_00393]|uniref:DUF1648 domain-containing protein n=1 Tax=Actinoplanes sp. NBC_00393 TaxID=2975953 RepID=UPI002E1F23D3